jgi:hypothetical protein
MKPRPPYGFTHLYKSAEPESRVASKATQLFYGYALIPPVLCAAAAYLLRVRSAVKCRSRSTKGPNRPRTLCSSEIRT